MNALEKKSVEHLIGLLNKMIIPRMVYGSTLKFPIDSDQWDRLKFSLDEKADNALTIKQEIYQWLNVLSNEEKK